MPSKINADLSLLFFGENHQMSGMAALMAANEEKLCKQKGEMDTEFIKRIARSYNRWVIALEAREQSNT